ncbi:MAG: hypothetical protein LBC70_02150, partial [Chitinispirillales bacterium]|nr:hypothetical protein [Chitinispirillales bacterium]
MGTFVSSKTRWLFSMAAILSALVLTGCGDKENNPVGPGGDLVLSAGQAWVDDALGITGYVFRSNGKVQAISPTGGNNWTVTATMDYTVNGNNLKMTTNGTLVIEYTFSIQGTVLTLTVPGIPAELIYTRKSGLNITDPTNPTDPTGGNLVLGPGEAWADDYPAGMRDGFIFLTGGKVLSINDYDGWEIDGEGTWLASGNTLTITIDGETLSFTYTVSGNTLTMTHADYGTEVFH